MANLPNLADRIEDLEVAANKPMTESLWRKFGSNLNFLLDFLGVTDGETTPAGALSDLSQAIETASSHTMDLVASFPTSGAAASVKTIGTFTKEKYLNQVIYPVINNNSGFTLTGYSQTIVDARLNFDSGGDIIFPFGGNRDNYKNINLTSNARYFSTALSNTLAGTGITTGNRITLAPVAVISHRDHSTDAVFKLNFTTGLGNFTAIEFYREYVLDVGSLGF